MAIHTAAINLLTFPQRWDAASRELVVRWLCLPVGSPLDAFVPGQPAFADAALRLQAQRVPGLAHVPSAADALASAALEPVQPTANKRFVFEQLGAQFQIDLNPAPAPVGAAMRFRKPVTESYRALAGRRQLGPELIGADEHQCMLHEALAGQPPAPVVLKSSLRWGQVIAYALRQPALATALGLMGELRVPVDDGFYQQGGWLWLTPHASGDYAADPALLALYAARIPPLLAEAPRAIYAPLLFPVDRNDFRLDEVLHDAERYDDGFARMVHGAQGDAPVAGGGEVRDAIRLAWDDETIAHWFSAQVAPESGATMGTAGFRVDVRNSADAGAWHSLQRVRSIDDLKVGDAVLGAYSGEAMVEVVPAQVSPARPGEFWMPAYFSAWRGASLVLTDSALARLAQPLPDEAGPDARHAALQLDREKTFEPVGDKLVKLRYGQAYDFRVRLADLTGGGPAEDDASPEPGDADAHPSTSITFRRHRRPGAVTVQKRPERARPTLVLEKPKLGYPEILYASGADALDDDVIDALRAARRDDAAAGVSREPGLTDPDVVALAIVLEVRALDGDGATWHEAYRVERAFDTPVLELPLVFEDHATLLDLPQAPAADAPLPLPTGRALRLRLVALGRNDAGYFGSDDARIGRSAAVELQLDAAQEAPPLAARDEPVLGFFFRTPPEDGSVPPVAQRLAQELGLQQHGMTLAGGAGRRTVFAASAELRHTLAPECSSITLSSQADLAQRWLIVLRLRIARDWSWHGDADPVLQVQRRVARGGGAPEAVQTVGTVRLPRATVANAATGLAAGDVRDAGRQFTDVVFLDAFDPKPRALPGELPTELTLSYELQPQYTSALVAAPPADSLPELRLPVTTPPSQLPKLMSAGIALAPYVAAKDYSSSEDRRRMLWLEFDQPVADPQDAYFVRVLVNAPDPLLTDEIIKEQRPEPPLSIDDEWMRLVHPGQPGDDSGAHAMAGLAVGAEAGRHFVVPLPDGMDEAASELFDMLTCEIRVGHDRSRWCTAQSRFGPALRAAGLQHPPPPLGCKAARVSIGVRVRAALATPLAEGRHVRPIRAKTRLWALLYARVQRADGRAWQNVLLQQRPLLPPEPGPNMLVLPTAQPALLYAEGLFPLDELHRSLRLFGLPDDAPLTAMAVEFLTAPEVADPLGQALGQARMLRASPLVAVPDAC